MNKLLIGVLGAALVSACSAPAVKDTLLIQQSAQEQAKKSGLSSQEVMDETRDLQILAQREDLYFYSPTYIAQAEDEIRDAESAFKDKLPEQKIITHALTGQQLLKRGLENKKTVLIQLKLSLDGLALLESLKADTLFASDYSDVQDDTKDLVILIEQGNTTQALKDQNGVLSDIADVEIKVLKKTYLNQAELALEKAVDADAEDFAPISIEKASLAVEKLATFIESNRKQLEAIDAETQKAIHLAQHAEHVSIAVEPMLKFKITDAEQHILFIEKLMTRIGNAFNQQDVTHLPLDNQSIALAQAAETVNKQAQAIKQQGQWQAERAELEAKLSELQSQLEATKKPAKPAESTKATQTNTPQSTDTLEATAITTPEPAATPVEETKPIVDATQNATTEATEVATTPIEKVQQANTELAKEVKTEDVAAQEETQAPTEQSEAVVQDSPEEQPSLEVQAAEQQSATASVDSEQAQTEAP